MMEPDSSLTEEVERLFHRLADLDDTARESFLKEHAISGELRHEVEALLACDDAEGRLTGLLNGQIHTALASDLLLNEVTVCGPYRLLRLLGRGGMSEVWLAERANGTSSQPVALKLPYRTGAGALVAQRLLRERSILASLEHRGIARLYDAGLAEGGQAYLALEYVDGVDLLRYCDERQLPVVDRLRLFLQVLEALQYAHARLVIHRDLKPANVLVNGEGETKLLDFGIAKLLQPGQELESDLTRAEGRALTVSYASPEQITGTAITTASDIFSLGLMLGELLCGERILAPADVTVPGGWENAILHGDAAPPSRKAPGEQAAAKRGTSARKLQRMLKGDLDVIVLKAVRKAPEDRYPTVNALRADIERYLRHEPVEARAESAWYRALRFVQRHRWGVLSVAAVAVALTVGVAVAAWQAGVAKREAQTADAIEQFTEDIFRINSRSHPDPVKAQHTTARELLDLGAKRVGTGFGNAPDARIRMLGILGDLYLDLGLEDEAVALQKQRIAVLRRQHGHTDGSVVPALLDLATALHASRSVNERGPLLQEAQTILDRMGDHTSRTRGTLLTDLAEDAESHDLHKAADYAQIQKS
jgi:eukaryotic-like serine/threonine-protein kinase